jgi:energy-coupling factor transport system substrate-specific component
MRSSARRLRELTVFAMLGALMFSTKIAMESIPGVHFLGLFIAAFTLVYRVKALIPIYVFVMLQGVMAGFAPWWLLHLYIWLPLWGMFMFAGRLNLPAIVKVPFYMLLCGLHGLAFGTLCVPVDALLIFGVRSLEGVIAYIIRGLPFDITHGISNFAMGTLIIPLSELLRKLNRSGF